MTETVKGPHKSSGERDKKKRKAHAGTRIQDLFLTKEVLYRLSYVGLTSYRNDFLAGFRNSIKPTGEENLSKQFERYAG